MNEHSNQLSDYCFWSSILDARCKKDFYIPVYTSESNDGKHVESSMTNLKAFLSPSTDNSFTGCLGFVKFVLSASGSTK